MKIRRTDATDAIARRARELREQSTEELLKKRTGQATDEEGKVELGIGRAINRELDVTRLAEERQARVEELKRRIQSGTYEQPDSDTLARSVGEELVYEVLTSTGTATE